MFSTRRAIFATTAVSVFAMAASAMAQTPDCAANPKAPGCPPVAKVAANAATPVGEVVVTGTRIKTSDFTSPSPITVVTPEQAELEGQGDIATLLQTLPVANNNVQINNFFTGFVVNGGPGVNTLSLRGLGSQRTLFLVNGQRLGPAGVGGTVGPVDLNTLNFPLAEISDIEILKDGASSIYGSDAIGGVVNIITKTNYDGGDLRVFYNPSQDGGGNHYEVDGSFGKTWSRGYINAGVSWYKQSALTLGERPYFSCSSDDVTLLSTGASGDLIDPATGQAKCENTFAPAVVDIGLGPQLDYRANPAAVAGGGIAGADVQGFQFVGAVICNDGTLESFDLWGGRPLTAGGWVNVAPSRASLAAIPTNYAKFLKGDALSPDERYMFNLYGGFNLTPHAQLYGSLILTERRSSQLNFSQFFTVVFGPAIGANNAFNPGFAFPIPIVPQLSFESEKVDYGRATLGLKGDFPNYGVFKNWTYDIYGEASQSHGYYTENFALADRVNATAGSIVGVGTGDTGCDVNGNINGGPTMAQLEPGVACVPVNFFAAVANGAFTPAEQAFLYRNETGWTLYNHYYVEGTAGGDLFNLPGGPIKASVGFQLRREEIDDNPPTDVQDGNDYNLLSAGRTAGSDTVEEAFGEVRLPIVKDLPLIDSLVFTGSGRFSHYKSYGSTFTYKVGLEWALTDWLAIRATQGTGFRAPALYELFLADQTSFLQQISIDPCINYGISGVSQNVQKNCASQGLPPNYAGASQSAEILTGGGIGNLKAETSLSRTAGVVVTPKWFGMDLSVSADYYTFDIKNQIQQFGAANIVFQCYNAPDFPNNPFCSLFTRDLNPASPTFQGITLVHDNFVNVAEQLDQGLDVTARWRQNLPADIKLTVDGQLDWTFYTNTILLGGSINNFLGQVGQPTFTGQINFRFDRGPWTFNYFLYMVGHSDDDKFVSNVNNNYLGLGQAVSLDHTAPFYTLTNISVRRTFKDWSILAGVNNLFDKSPALYSAEGFQNRIGQVPLQSQYDPIGRAFFFELDKKFLILRELRRSPPGGLGRAPGKR